MLEAVFHCVFIEMYHPVISIIQIYETQQNNQNIQLKFMLPQREYPQNIYLLRIRVI